MDQMKRNCFKEQSKTKKNIVWIEWQERRRLNKWISLAHRLPVQMCASIWTSNYSNVAGNLLDGLTSTVVQRPKNRLDLSSVGSIDFHRVCVCFHVLYSLTPRVQFDWCCCWWYWFDCQVINRCVLE